jgi:hypothetical protein
MKSDHIIFLLTLMNRDVKFTGLMITLFLAVFVLSGCKKENRQQDQALTQDSNNIESKYQEQLDQQAQEIASMKEAEEQRNKEEEEAKKEECEQKLKTAEKYLADSQSMLAKEQEVLRIAESGKCDDCYKQCVRSYGCADDQDPDWMNCDNDKKICKEKDASNLKNRRSDVAQDLDSVKRHMASLQSIKDECSQYLQ